MRPQQLPGTAAQQEKGDIERPSVRSREPELHQGQDNLAASVTDWGRKQAERQIENQTIPLSTPATRSAKCLFTRQVNPVTVALVARSLKLLPKTPNTFNGKRNYFPPCHVDAHPS